MELNEGLIVRTIMNYSEDTIYFKDRESKFIFNSKAHSSQFKVDNPMDLIGKSDFDFFPESFAKNALKDEQIIMETRQPMLGRVEKWEKPNGEVVWLLASKYPLYDEAGRVVGTWGSSKDITVLKKTEEALEIANAKLKKANEELESLSIIDSLSGLYNHRHFYDDLDKAFKLAKRHKEKGCEDQFSLILMDIDLFKHTNDTFGHLVGDKVISHIAKIIKNSTRSTDGCYRYGGDEFIVLLNDTTLEASKGIAENIRMNIERSPIQYDEILLPMTVSIGISSYSEVKDLKELVYKADQRLYLSKREGRNKIT